MLLHPAGRSASFSGAVALLLAMLPVAACQPVRDDPARPAADRFEGGVADAVLPGRFDTLDLLLKQISAVVRGTVTDIAHAYDDCEGPRTIVRLAGVRTLIGTDAGSEVELRTFGGPLPDGHFVSASELPRYVKGATYLVFLRNTDWRFSPVVGDLAFREETIAGRAVLVDSDGFGVSGIGAQGIERRTVQLTGPAVASHGRQVRHVVSPRLDDAGAILPRASGRGGKAVHGAADAAGRGGDRSVVDLVSTGSSERPAILPGLGRAELAAALSAEQLAAHIGRAAEAAGVQIGGRLQSRPRLGCWKSTPTDRWQRRSR